MGGTCNFGCRLEPPPRELRAADKDRSSQSGQAIFGGGSGGIATGVDVSVGWRFHAHLWRPMHSRVLELDQLRWQKRDLRQKLALEKPSEGDPCGRIHSLLVGYDANILHPHEGENGPPPLCVLRGGGGYGSWCYGEVPIHDFDTPWDPCKVSYTKHQLG